MDDEKMQPEEHPESDRGDAPEPQAEGQGGGEGNGQAAAAVPVEAEDNKKWFIVHTYSGFEQKVAESLRSRAQALGFDDKIGQILTPTEAVVELRGGKKVTSKRLVYLSTAMVKMEMND